MSTIAEQSAATSAAAATRLPAEVVTAFGAEQAALVAAGVPAGVPAPGVAFPDGDLLDAEGQPTSIASARAGRPAVVVLYRGDWCPYCNLTLRTYQAELLPVLAERGVELIALSPQRPDGALSMQEKNDLAFPVLSDPGNQVAGSLGVVSIPAEATRTAQSKLGLDVAAGNADGTPAAPMPTVAVVDAGGVLRWIDVHPDFTTRTEVADIVGALDRL